MGPAISIAPRFAAAVSGHPDAIRAAADACRLVGEALEGGVTDLVIAFVSATHVPAMGTIAAIVRRELRAACLIAVSAESVVGGALELERTPGVSLFGARLPGVTITPFATSDLEPMDAGTPEGAARVGRAIGAGPDLRAVLLFADPFTVPMNTLLPALNAARTRRPDGTGIGAIIGGFASAAAAPGGNALVVNDMVFNTGAAGVSLRGPVKIDTIVSQGCRGFGPNLVVTAVRRNVILTLGGRPALEALREAVEGLDDRDKPLLQKGLFIGRVVNEYKDRFGRDDYLIRNVAGVEATSGAVAVADFLRVGQTIRFHLRDAATAHEDLAMLLDAQQLKDPPIGALLFTCNGRGTRLFDVPHHDASAVARAFRPVASGEALAKPGAEISAAEPSVPLAGFFAAGEIGPVGHESFVHGHTACLALFRAEPSGPEPRPSTP